MSEPDLPKYLVLDDYETAGIWFIVEARDEEVWRKPESENVEASTAQGYEWQ
jgi:hypothetical protein